MNNKRWYKCPCCRSSKKIVLSKYWYNIDLQNVIHMERYSHISIDKKGIVEPHCFLSRTKTDERYKYRPDELRIEYFINCDGQHNLIACLYSVKLKNDLVVM